MCVCERDPLEGGSIPRTIDQRLSTNAGIVDLLCVLIPMTIKYHVCVCMRVRVCVCQALFTDPLLQIAGVPVVGVVREGASAVHILPRPLEEGAEVEMVVDWGRRFDHMQQHSGGCGRVGVA